MNDFSGKSLCSILYFSVFWGMSLFIPAIAHASCGSASCFITIGGQQSTQPKGLVRVDLSYSYIPQKGNAGNRVASEEDEGKRQILDEHREFQTITQRAQLRINYGLTDRLTAQLRIPVLARSHDHNIEVGDLGGGQGIFENFDASGLGDIEAMGKYAFLPTLRSLFVVGAGMQFPTGNSNARDITGKIQEPTLQIGRGAFGVVGQIYSSYELIPHTLNPFFLYTYRHTFANRFGYQFGDMHMVSGGLNYNVTPKITLSSQVNWRLLVHNEFKSDLEQAGPATASNEPTILDSRIKRRPVANTGSTALFFTPGFLLHLTDNSTWYFFIQIPLVRDFNGGLEQSTTYLTGFQHTFSLEG